MTATASRTQDEILARIAEVKADDFLGFRQEVLIHAFDYEHAEVAARGYLTFAIGKILGHRGISAGRSVEKLREFAWLMGRDDVVDAMDDADYPQYGAPQVKAFATTLGWPWPGEVDADDAAALERMAQGKHCDPDGCAAGCGQ